jgi:protein AbiQ
MKFLFLTQQFYDDHKECTEIEQKLTRPYSQVHAKINGVQFAIPLRSGIRHKHVLWTNKLEKCGLDFSKAVVIVDDKYIDKTTEPHIRQNEFDSLRGKEYIVEQKMLKYISDYKKAKTELNIERNKILCQYSTMQYFEEYIGNIEIENKEADSSKLEINNKETVVPEVSEA